MSSKQSNSNSDIILAPQCAVCGTALSGPLSYIFRLAGISRGTSNPNTCTRCNMHIVEGRIVELTVLFADLTKFTELTHELGPEQTHKVVSAFLDMATNILIRYGAFIDKYIGDAVMAFFNIPIRQEIHTALAVDASAEIQAGLEKLRKLFNLDLNASIGIATGWARVGVLGSTVRKDYTAIGDVVNLAARLEAQASPGEILVQDNVYQKVTANFPDICPETLALKGFREPVVGYRLGGCGGVPHRHGEKYREPAPAMSLGSVIFALLGAPCAVGTMIGPIAMGLGAGSLFGAMTSHWAFFDKPMFQYPLFALATAGSLGNLYTLRYAHKIRKQRKEGMIAMTRLERSRMMLVTGFSIATLLLVTYEIYLHIKMPTM
ncbi:MAG: adenylate/guanylate cyclase domain-containing protein, partial [Candidatus Tectomicrobia bacterium]|nr:adenylate/guanylate cyclase domain-containing protein [Candidatus Tectomicrobia bacterium]